MVLIRSSLFNYSIKKAMPVLKKIKLMNVNKANIYLSLINKKISYHIINTFKNIKNKDSIIEQCWACEKKRLKRIKIMTKGRYGIKKKHYIQIYFKILNGTQKNTNIN